MIDLAKEFGLSIGRNFSRECTQDYIPIESITDGVLVLKSGGKRKRYVKVVKIIPINFALKDTVEQDAVIINFYKWLKSASLSSFQIKVTTDKTNIEKYLRGTKQAIEKESSDSCIETMEHYVDFLEEEGKFETFERNYYLIFEYEVGQYENVAKTEEAVIAALNKAQSQILWDLGFRT